MNKKHYYSWHDFCVSLLLCVNHFSINMRDKTFIRIKVKIIKNDRNSTTIENCTVIFQKITKLLPLAKCHVPIHLRHALDLVMTDYILKLLTKDNDLLTTC